jgi:sulfate adenylyltransferase subunit 1 (EFTu-like GTPase family)
MYRTWPLHLVVTGHPDHGKSTLIGRLLLDSGRVDAVQVEEIRRLSRQAGFEDQWAFLVDHLEAERQDGLTIDTAQVFVRTGARSLVLIDVPGHPHFLRNMITGATRAEAAVLVIAVDEGLRAQTRRHALLIALLGIRQVIVACNKIDLVDFSKARFEETALEARQLLSSLSIEPLSVIPVSAARGDNVASSAASTPWYHGPVLIEAIENLDTTSPEQLPVRFAIQDSYAIDGQTCLAGRVLAGRVRAGDSFTVYPSQAVVTVREIVRFPPNHEPAEAGECVALRLESAPGLEGAHDVERGAILVGETWKNPPAISRKITSRVFWWDLEPMQVGQNLILRCSTQEAKVSVAEILRTIDSSTLLIEEGSSERLDAPNVGDVVFAADKPMITEPFKRLAALGRLVLERNGLAAGAGIVL